MAIEHLVRVTQITRPNAQRETLFVSVPFTHERQIKYEQLRQDDGRFTWERGGMLGDRVIVCIENDDGDFEQRVAKDAVEAEQRVSLRLRHV